MTSFIPNLLVIGLEVREYVTAQTRKRSIMHVPIGLAPHFLAVSCFA